MEYVTLPGWKSDTTSVRKFEDLPVNARCYVRKIEEIVGVPGRLIINIRIALYQSCNADVCNSYKFFAPCHFSEVGWCWTS